MKKSKEQIEKQLKRANKNLERKKARMSNAKSVEQKIQLRNSVIGAENRVLDLEMQLEETV